MATQVKFGSIWKFLNKLNKIKVLKLNLADHGYVVLNWLNLAKVIKIQLNQGMEAIFG